MGSGDSRDPDAPRADGGVTPDCTVLPCRRCVPIDSMRVTALEYVNDHGVLTDYQKDFNSGGKKFSKPQWTSSHSYPVSFSMDTYIEVYLTIEVKPANACPEVGDIKGSTAAGAMFELKGWTFRPGLNKIYMIAHTALPHKIQTGDLEILWELSGTSVPLGFFDDFTWNMMYVTYDTPYNDTKLDNEVTEKRLKWICTLASGDTNGHDSLQKVHDFGGKFALGADTPDNHWMIATGLRCECVDLAKFYMLSAEILGLKTGEVLYLYPKLSKGTKESPNPQDMEAREVKTSVPAHDELHRWHGSDVPKEDLMLVDNNGGWNRYEACYKFTHPDKAGKMLTRYYAGGAAIYNTKEEVMKAVCKQTQWIFHVPKSHDPVRVCENPGPFPAESWK